MEKLIKKVQDFINSIFLKEETDEFQKEVQKILSVYFKTIPTNFCSVNKETYLFDDLTHYVKKFYKVTIVFKINSETTVFSSESKYKESVLKELKDFCVNNQTQITKK